MAWSSVLLQSLLFSSSSAEPREWEIEIELNRCTAMSINRHTFSNNLNQSSSTPMPIQPNLSKWEDPIPNPNLKPNLNPKSEEEFMTVSSDPRSLRTQLRLKSDSTKLSLENWSKWRRKGKSSSFKECQSTQPRASSHINQFIEEEISQLDSQFTPRMLTQASLLSIPTFDDWWQIEEWMLFVINKIKEWKDQNCFRRWGRR